MTASTASTVPAEFIGVWERIELSVGGTILPGAGRSYWFQGPSQFLDVRGAGDGIQSEAFAGIATWDPASQMLTWRHDLDLHPGARDDTGRVEWWAGDLIEHGSAETVTGVIDYIEVWRRRSVQGAAMTIAGRVGGTGRLARCDEHLAVLVDDRPAGTVRAGHATDRGWAWVFDLVLGSPLARDAARSVAADHRPFTSFGHRWTVTECSAPPA